MSGPLRTVAHRHDWHWVDSRLGRADEGEFCVVCGRVRDRDKSLPPVALGLSAFSNLYLVRAPRRTGDGGGAVSSEVWRIGGRITLTVLAMVATVATAVTLSINSPGHDVGGNSFASTVLGVLAGFALGYFYRATR